MSEKNEIFIIGSGIDGEEAKRMIGASGRDVTIIGAVDMGNTTLSEQNIVELKKQIPEPVKFSIEPTPLTVFADTHFERPTKKPKHHNSKQKTRKKNGKKTHRKK